MINQSDVHPHLTVGRSEVPSRRMENLGWCALCVFLWLFMSNVFLLGAVEINEISQDTERLERADDHAQQGSSRLVVRDDWEASCSDSGGAVLISGAPENSVPPLPFIYFGFRRVLVHPGHSYSTYEL